MNCALAKCATFIILLLVSHIKRMPLPIVCQDSWLLKEQDEPN